MNKYSIYNSFQHHFINPRITYYYYKDWNEFHMPTHDHPAIEIMYMVNGQSKIEVHNHTFLLKQKQYILIDSHVPHRLIVEKGKPCRMLNIEFILQDCKDQNSVLGSLALECKEVKEFLQNKKSFIIQKDINEVYHSLRSLVLELDTQKYEKKLMVNLLIAQLLIQISRNQLESQERELQDADYYVSKIVNYIHENYDCDIKTTELSQLVHLHPNYLHKIFKNTMNCTIIEYLTKIRIDKAKMLLSKSEMSITEISGFVGINSSQYFSKVFKKEMGVSPLAYRELASCEK
ncbi:AraC family transcriptional regulator [Gracilibacillus caseinilyticus]|uniref:AraC family transcriptional regulator n=1 Tax=Gracilibacillus caseinilyticus TaxID=2932256 RepID=A0ABY4F1E4_9BACI|nr:AraC family transcriptional regulator [Gracilibacillus caseinilyticus]UOQ50355.1 AraC family transcriptional regulator [Gracilibacillus caseinilyticus]